MIKVFDNLNDPTPSVYADLSTNVHDILGPRLLGMALDPQFTTGRPFVYVLYTLRRRDRRHRRAAGAMPAPRLRGHRPTGASSAAGCPS